MDVTNNDTLITSSIILSFGMVLLGTLAFSMENDHQDSNGYLSTGKVVKIQLIRLLFCILIENQHFGFVFCINEKSTLKSLC